MQVSTGEFFGVSDASQNVPYDMTHNIWETCNVPGRTFHRLKGQPMTVSPPAAAKELEHRIRVLEEGLALAKARLAAAEARIAELERK